jgi:hypothetical protein
LVLDHPIVAPPRRADRDRQAASPAGQPDKFELTLKLVLPRVVAERLTARAIRETRRLEAIIQEILEGAAK